MFDLYVRGLVKVGNLVKCRSCLPVAVWSLEKTGYFSKKDNVVCQFSCARECQTLLQSSFVQCSECCENTRRLGI